MIGGIISKNWVYEPASSNSDERWLCRQGKATDRSACKDKTSSYINTSVVEGMLDDYIELPDII